MHAEQPDCDLIDRLSMFRCTFGCETVIVAGQRANLRLEKSDKRKSS
jgi:hypothetical protein